MIGCYHSSNCVNCAFDGKCLVQIGLVEHERVLHEMLGLLGFLPIACEIYEKLEAAR